MKKIIKIVLGVLLFGGIIFLVIAANIKNSNQLLKTPNITIHTQDEIPLMTELELKQELSTHRLFWDSMTKNELKIGDIEDFIKQMNEVYSADVYTNLGTDWFVNVKTRRPLARIMGDGFDDFYLDSEYRLMRLSPYMKPKILPFTGIEHLIPQGIGFEQLINNDSLKTKCKLDQIYRISNYVCNDAFYNAQIVQIHYTQEDGFILIPRVGKQEVKFGEATSEEMVNDKFNKLTVFYEEVIPYEGWDKYESINLKFKDQIVAKKKE